MNGFGMKYLKRRAALFCVLAAALLAFPAAALAANADAAVEGKWLRIPNFPEDANVLQFEDDGKGTIKYLRELGDEEVMLGIYRMPFPVEPSAENMEKVFGSLREDLENTIEKSGGDADSLQFEPSDALSEHLGYTCRIAVYEMDFEPGLRSCADLFAIGDGYVFMVKLSVDKDVEDDYEEKAAEWFATVAVSDGPFPKDAGSGEEEEEEEDAPGVERDGDFVAMAYLYKNFTSMSWEIVDPGEYDGEEFELPAGLISSVKVMPGYRITLYERPGFGGKSAGFEGDTEDLREWSRRASSLKIQRIREVDPDEAEAWVAAVRGAEDKSGRFTFMKLEPGRLAKGIEKHKKTIEEFKDIHPFQWIEMTDGERDEWGKKLIGAFKDCGADVSGVTPKIFSSLMNNFLEFYGPNSGFTSFRAACCVFGIDDDVFYR